MRWLGLIGFLMVMGSLLGQYILTLHGRIAALQEQLAEKNQGDDV